MSTTSLRLVLGGARPRRQHLDPSAFLRACRPLSPTGAVPRSVAGPRRPFAHTIVRAATTVLQNPRVDDDGHDMTIEISERAAKRLKQITGAPAPKNTLVRSSTSAEAHLRVTVTSGGCHGFQYLMSLEDASKVDQEEDTVFGDQEVAGPGQAHVVMDLASLELLKGSTVDYTTELIGSQFKIVGNPRASSSCGCGTSFDIQ